MNIFEAVLLNTILIITPLLCYFIYVFFEKTLDKNKNGLFLDCALFTAVYLLIKFGNLSYNDVPIILLDIPLIIAYIKKRKISIIILSLLIILYYHNTLNINLYFVIFEYLFYFVLYILTQKCKKDGFPNIYLILKILIFYNYVYFNKVFILDNSEKYFDFAILVIFFYIVTKFLINIFHDIDSLTSLYNITMNIEDEKKTKESLFKITHEIKNPIAVCKGYLDMFDTENKSHPKKYIPILKEEINRVLVLLEDFLCIKQIKIEKEEMDLSLLLEDIQKSFSLMLKDRNIELLCKQIDDTYIMADYNRLKQVLVNIIKNSMEAIMDEGKIKISVIKNKTVIKIIIKDNGTGMDEEGLERIKEAFFTTKKNGTGLGIYLSNEIIMKHNGKIKYENVKDGGTKVTISLPV